MKLLISLFYLVPILGLCFIGACAALVGLQSLDRWCARQLTDTDGQPE